MGELKVDIIMAQNYRIIWFIFFSVLSLPTFRQLLEVPLANDGADIERVQRTVQFSTGGLGTYFSNQNQVGEFGYFLLTNLFNYEPSNFTYLIKPNI